MKKNIIFILGVIFFSYLLLHAETSTNELTITLRLFPPSYTLFINNNVVKPAPLSEYVNTVVLTPGTYSFLVKSPGYINKQLNITLKENIQIEEKLEKDDSLLELIQEIKTGKQPKSVEFTPDGKYLVTALLADNGIDIFSTNNFTKVKRIKPPEPYPAKTAFVEIAFSSRLNEMWVSQMSTASVHIFDLDNFSYKATISTKGKGPKVIIFGSEEKYAYVSNWFSNTIAVIDTDTRSVKHMIEVSPEPRGMAVTPDNRYLYVCIYYDGTIQKINLNTYTVEKTINWGYGSKRHIVHDPVRKLFYVSDMYTGGVYVFSSVNDKLIKKIPVDHKINTIKLSPDRLFLFASSRGPNNPKTYLIKGPQFGKLYVIDTTTFDIVDWVWGRNQPTGLGISWDGEIVAFSDFKDENIEVYRFKKK